MAAYGRWWSAWIPALLVGLWLGSVVQSLDVSGSFYDEPSLVCGDDLMEYSLHTVADGNATVQLSTIDADGHRAVLLDNTVNPCSVWLTSETKGVSFLYVPYYSCYLYEKDGYYMMTIFLEVNTTGEWEVYQKEVLRCPIIVMDDAPSVGDCSNVPRESRLSCGGTSVSQDVCSQNGCCYDQTDSRNPCYYGNKVTAQCTMDGQLSVAVSKDATVPSLILSSVKLLRGSGPGCNPVVQNDVFLIFNFPLSACGTTYTDDGTAVVYENDLVADQDIETWRGSSITRDSTFRLHIRCSYVAGGSVPLSVEVFTLPPPSPASSTGPLNLELRIAKDPQYQQYYADAEYPILKVLRDPVFVEVRILNRNDPNLVLMLDQCWATNSETPILQPQWPLLIDGCPFGGDNYKTQPVNIGNSGIQFPLHYKRFIVSTFTFVNSGNQQPIGGLVYFHCSASVCVPSPGNPCVTTCNSARRRRAHDLESGTLVSAEGPVAFYQGAEEFEGVHGSGPLSKMGWILAVVPGCTVGVILIIFLLKRQNKYSIKRVNI
ncbi:zona pellucida sperm-binding protein 4-like [Hyperolius riggenbachi]|uniref:zona pellucida sperm-binding protein 4-like n=1 Tax=Hyperolius riggenbachi TaxID=752182 RepID=UPI0035A3C131